MGDKTVQGARTTRPVRHSSMRQDGATMLRSINVFAAATRSTSTRPRKRASTRARTATSRKASAKSPQDLTETRKKNLAKANRALKKMRAEKKA